VFEVAETDEERMQGLRFRDHLEIEAGMLFIFPQEKQPTFWMKDVSLPLDIIWIDADKKIATINENVQPCLDDNCSTIKPSKKITYVLEINEGLAKKLNLKVGQSAKISLD